MERKAGWEARLKNVIMKHQRLPSQYGVSDCYLIPDDAVEALTGERMFPDVTYDSEMGAAKALVAHGFHTVEDAFASKFEAVHPALAQRGDIGVTESNGQICGGVFSAIGFVTRDNSKVVYLPVSSVKSAFKVARK